MKQFELANVKITDGYFWKKQRMNEEVTIPATYQQFYKTGRVEAFKLKWRNGQPDRPHIFWDSDVAKWIEGAAYTLTFKRDENLEKLIDSIVHDMAIGQTDDGYFNIHFQTSEFANRFTRRGDHELYCAGHLIEAAVAYKKATGKDTMLNVMCRYADYIEKVFTDKDRDPNFKTPGHQEIELALVKLYHETGNRKYLDLSRFFIDTRGTLEGERHTFNSWADGTYAQDHVPIADQTTAVGHSVRCLYMFAGAADIAREFNDEKLKKACETVFDNIQNKRMYVTGGLGGNHSGESFSYDYDLPNELAYTETCASIAMILFSQRMYLLTGDVKYMDMTELQFYNAVMPGISLYGDRFFYCNPLEVNPERRDNFRKISYSQFSPEYERPEYFGCSCCPPNVIRLIASLGQYMYHYDENDGNKIYVNLYNSSELEYGGLKIKQETNYPYDGKVSLTISSDDNKNEEYEICLRIPEWCNGRYTAGFNDEAITGAKVCNGYLCVKCSAGKITLELPMDIQEIYANPEVHYCAGRVAVKRGPIVYCAESIDNGRHLKSAVIKKDADFSCEKSEIFGNEIVKISCNAIMSDDFDNSSLYSTTPYKKTEKRLTLIPYATWANRGRSEMHVWLLKE